MDRLCLNTYEELYMVSLSEILYIQADDHYCQVRYVSGVTFMLPYGLGQVEEMIRRAAKGSHLVRLGRRYIVNTDRILYVSTAKQSLVLVDSMGAKHDLRVSKPILRGLIDGAAER